MSHTVSGVKMTMHIDEDVLAEVMALTGAKTKTQAVELALNNLARRAKLKRALADGLGVSGSDLAAMFAGHPGDNAVAGDAALKVAEDPAPYGTPPAR